MTAKKLIEILKKAEPDTPVLVHCGTHTGWHREIKASNKAKPRITQVKAHKKVEKTYIEEEDWSLLQHSIKGPPIKAIIVSYEEI